MDCWNDPWWLVRECWYVSLTQTQTTLKESSSPQDLRLTRGDGILEGSRRPEAWGRLVAEGGGSLEAERGGRPPDCATGMRESAAPGTGGTVATSCSELRLAGRELWREEAADWGRRSGEGERRVDGDVGLRRRRESLGEASWIPQPGDGDVGLRILREGLGASCAAQPEKRE